MLCWILDDSKLLICASVIVTNTKGISELAGGVNTEWISGLARDGEELNELAVESILLDSCGDGGRKGATIRSYGDLR